MVLSGLQWSRANDGAETFSERKGQYYAKLALQWSRANNGAETLTPATTSGMCTLLQWSRANNGAETWISIAVKAMH